MKKFEATVYRPDGISFEKVTIESLNDIYRYLDCKTFDVVTVFWNSQMISIYLDDKGLFKPNNLGSEIKGYNQPLFGNLLIARSVDGVGNTLSLPSEFNELEITKHISIPLYITKG